MDSSPTQADPHTRHVDSGESAAAHRVLVLVCTFNERDNIVNCVERIRRSVAEADILVIDDNSPDGTAAAIAQHCEQDPHIQVRVRTEERGLGSAIRSGLKQGIESGYEWIVNLDADLSHAPEEIPDLLARARGGVKPEVDVVIGSRYAPGGRIEGWPLQRRVLSRAFNAASRVAGGLPAKDCTGAFRAYRASMLQQIELDRVKTDGYAFLEEILAAIVRAGGTIAEVPICFVDRQHGESKLGIHEAFGAIRMLARLGRMRLGGK